MVGGSVDKQKRPPEELARLVAARSILIGVSLTTACRCGAEHVISDMLDMHEAAH